MNVEQQTKNVIKSAITKYADKQNVSKIDTQVLIFAKDEKFTPGYKICYNFKPLEEVKFKDLLNVKIDLLNKEFFATPYIQTSLKGFARELGCSFNDVNVIIFTQTDDISVLKLYLFKGNDAKREIKISEITGGE